MPLTGKISKAGDTIDDAYIVIGATSSDTVNLSSSLDVYRSKDAYDNKYPAAFSIPIRVNDDRTKLQVDLLEAYAVAEFSALKVYTEDGTPS